MKIKFEFLTGEAMEIEVPAVIGEVAVAMDKEIYNSNRRETRRHSSVESLHEKGIQIADKKADVISIIENRETYEALYKAMDKLLPQHRELIRKVFFEGKSFAQIAREEDVYESAIRDRLNRIYQQMKKLLTN